MKNIINKNDHKNVIRVRTMIRIPVMITTTIPIIKRSTPRAQTSAMPNLVNIKEFTSKYFRMVLVQCQTSPENFRKIR